MASRLLGIYSKAFHLVDQVIVVLKSDPNVNDDAISKAHQLFHKIRNLQSVEFEKEWARHYNIDLDDKELPDDPR